MTTNQAAGELVLTAWEVDTYDKAEGTTLARVSAPKTTRGKPCRDQPGRALDRAGCRRESGRLRPGRARDWHAAGHVRDLRAASHRPGTAGEPLVIRIIPNTASGELEGLRGTPSITGDVEKGHTYTIDDDFG